MPRPSSDGVAETRDAIAALYETHFERVARFIAVRIGNLDEAEDLASEVFVRAIRAAESYTRGEVPMEAWVFAIARNLTVDYVRQKGRRPYLEVLDDVCPPVGNDDPTKRIERQQEVAALYSAMEELTEAQREVLSLRFGAELTSEEAGKALGKSAGAVREMQRAAIEKLRGILGQQDGFSALSTDRGGSE